MKYSVFISSLVLSALLTQPAWADHVNAVSGLKMPESVVVSKDGNVYVSEIGEFGKDGDGQITHISPSGQVQVFATGLDDPKGLAIIGNDVYVADKTRILKITPQGQWTVFVEAKSFSTAPQFLNDLEADTQGNLYVSDSGDLKGTWGAIYKISPQGQVTMLIETNDDARVKSPNGLLMSSDESNLLWVDFSSGTLYSLNLGTKQMVELAQGFGGSDGIVRTPNGSVYVSDWKNGKVFRVKQGEVSLLKGGFQAAADIALSADGQYILVPDMKAGTLEYAHVLE